MRMSSFLLSAALLAVLSAQAAHFTALALDEDLGFDVSAGASDDFQLEINSNLRNVWSNKEITATVGKAFHLIIPKDVFGTNVQTYEAKRTEGKALPLWLLFDKVGGVFWGVPLKEDIETLHLVIRATIDNEKNISESLLTIKIIDGDDAGAKKGFSSNEQRKCPSTEDNTVLTLLIDKSIRAIKPKQRVIAINNIAKFFGLPFSAFTLKPQLEKDDITDSSVVLAGPGNLQTRASKLTSLVQVPVGCEGRLWTQTASLVHQLKQQARDGTITEVIGLPLIGWRVKTETGPVLRAKRDLDDGSGDFEDEDYYDDNYDENYDVYDEDVDEKKTTTSKPTTTTTTTAASTTHPHRHHHGEGLDLLTHPIPTTKTVEVATETITPDLLIPDVLVTSTSTSTTTTTTTTTTTERPSTAAVSSSTTTTTTVKPLEVGPSNENYDYDYYDGEDDDDESETVVPEFGTTSTTKKTPLATSSIRPVPTENLPETVPTTTPLEVVTEPTVIEEEVQTVGFTPPTTTTSTTTLPTTSQTTQVTTPAVAITSSTTSSTTTSTTPMTPTMASTTIQSSLPPVAATTTENIETSTIPPVIVEEDEETTIPTTPSTTTTIKQTTIREIPSTQRTTTVREITENIDYEAKNFPPHIENRLQHMSVIAGKIFRFVIPQNTFKDFEDGNNLTLEFLNAKGEVLSKDSWCHFNPLRREIYGLPLEEDVSKWEYVVKATDSEGASVSDRLTIQVQQHKSQRVVNHEFSLLMRIEKQLEFPHFVDWCLKTLRALGKIYNTNMSEITVRNVNYSGDPVVFTWTNDSMPTNYCPTDEIDQLFKILTANDRGDPSRELNLLLAPELRVKRVVKHGLGVCETTPQAPVTPPTNFPPFLRNPVDHINATMGELLVFRVPDDTFYDPEDTDSRTLNISLLTGDRQPIKSTNWLQFDSKNREFYGIPRKVGRSEYQLICVDSAGLPASDSLEIVVYAPPKVHYNVEFSMTIETPFETFVNSAGMQRKFVEKLQEIFGDKNASFIHLNPFKQKHESTIVTWFNKSLSTEKCSHDEINRLESMMKNHDRSIASRVHSIMDPEFPVSTIKILPVGNCRNSVKTIPVVPAQPEDSIIPIDDKTPESNAQEYQYLMTFIIPAVIISIMLFLAAIAACVLYRRRRTGKMNVEEDGRQSYGNKGIPVIFQEELEEKPEPGTKTPVILKDEKPPLAPPEYSKSGSLKLNDDSEPYQPPPPFTRTQDNGRQPRPKPTPTYRKPPPYVPP